MSPTLKRMGMVATLIFLMAHEVQGQGKSNNGMIQLRAEVRAMLELRPLAAEVKTDTVTATVRGISPDSIIVESRIVGNGARQAIRIPIVASSNTRSFLLRSSAQGGVATGSVQFVSPNSSFFSRARPLADEAVFALAVNEAGFQRVAGSVEIEFEPIEAGEVRMSRVQLQITKNE
ncbi:MAG: hypothetical protein ACRD3E_00600 [Terriglobales bacterium]